MSSVDILVKGRNRALLFQKLARADVSVLNCEKAGEDIVIRIKYKDLKKAFAIFGNSWYNKQIGLHGAARIADIVKRNVALVFSVLAFLVAAAIIDGYLFFVKIDGVSFAKRREIESVLSESGVKCFSRFSDIDMRETERKILSQVDGLEFVSVKKSANKLIIDAVEQKNSGIEIKKVKDIIAKRSGVITYANVIRGKLKKNVGDRVFAGETIVEGVIEDGENVYSSYAVAEITLTCEFVTERFIDDTSAASIEGEIASAKAFLSEEAELVDYSLAETVGGYLLKINLEYKVTEIGGRIE